MTAAKLHRIFRILSTAGLSLVYEGNGQAQRSKGGPPPKGSPKQAKTSSR